MTLPVGIQRRYRELGRIRLGEKGPKGEPRKRTTFRLTSPSKPLLERAAELWGGTVRLWKQAPTEGQWELGTDAERLACIIPPQDLRTTYELWSGGGVERRCDGFTEMLTGDPCLCDFDNRECRPTTHLQVMLPQIPDVGVWRVTTHGYHAAAELPGTVDLLAMLVQSGRQPAAELALEERVSRRGGQTQRFVVPVLALPNTMLELAGGQIEGGMPVIPSLTRPGPSSAATPAGGDRPALPYTPPPDTVEGWESGAPTAPPAPPPPDLPSSLPPGAAVGHDGDGEGDHPAPPPLPSELEAIRSTNQADEQTRDALGVLLAEDAPAETMAHNEAKVRELFRLAEADRLSERWKTSRDGIDALHRALRKRGAEHVSDLRAAELKEFAAEAWQTARRDWVERGEP